MSILILWQTLWNVLFCVMRIVIIKMYYFRFPIFSVLMFFIYEPLNYHKDMVITLNNVYNVKNIFCLKRNIFVLWRKFNIKFIDCDKTYNLIVYFDIILGSSTFCSSLFKTYHFQISAFYIWKCTLQRRFWFFTYGGKQ